MSATEYESVDLPLSLEDLCFVHLVCNIEHFSPESMSLLPTKLRCRLLQNLPIIDVCRLEESAVANGIIDLDFEIWRPLCHARLPQEVVTLALKDYFPSTRIKWRDEFFCSLVCMILNHFHPHFPFRPFAPALLTFAQDVLFAVPEYVGIANWQQLGVRHPFLAVTVKDTTLLQWPPGFVYPQHMRDFFRPWLVPPRHGWIVDPRRQCHSSSQLLHIVMEECNYQPKRLLVICDKFSNSEFMVTHCCRSLLQKFLSPVESLILMDSLHDTDLGIDYTDVFDDDKNTCGIIPRFMLEAFLSQEEPQLKSLKLEGSVKFVAHTLQCLSPLLAELKSTDSHSYSLQSIYKATMSNVPYSKLQSIAIEIRSQDVHTENIVLASRYLDTIISCQTSLSHLCFKNWLVTPVGSLDLITSLAKLLLKPEFRLIFENMILSIGMVKVFIGCLLLIQSGDHRDYPSSLSLDNVVIAGDSQVDFPPQSLVNMFPRAEDGGEGKCLSLLDVQFSDDATAASFFDWLRSQERLKLKSIDLASIDALESENICDCFASNPNAQIKYCRMSNIPLQLSSAKTYEALFWNLHLECLEFYSCSVDLPLLTRGLRKQSPVQTLTDLALHGNALERCSDADL